MNYLAAVTIGVLYAAGIYMLLRRSMLKLIVGLILLSQAANLLIFTSGSIGRGKPPIIHDSTGSYPAMVDPIPQALILTAIVISFGVSAFALVLLSRAFAIADTDDLDDETFTRE